MSLRTVVEVALHFESFRNVDLFHQGLYHLKARLYRDEGEQRLGAIPYAYSTCPAVAEKSKSARTDHHHLIPAHILEENGTFSTRSFLIRYCEEEVELNDIAQFRIEVGLEEEDLNAPFTLEVDLMFADLTQHGGADRFGEQPDVDSTEFKSVSTQFFRIHGFAQGLHEFCPIVFDEFHFCLANIVLHTVLLDYRFRLRPLMPVPKQQSGTDADGTGSQQQDVSKNASMQNGALSLIECIYGKRRGRSREELLQLTETFYRTRFSLLAGAHSKLAEFFDKVVNTCLTPAQRSALSDDTEVLGKEPFDAIPVYPKSLNGDIIAADGKIPNGHGPNLRAYLAAQLAPTSNEQMFIMQVTHDLNTVSGQLLKLWHKFLLIATYSCREIAALLRGSWEVRIGNSWKTCIVRETVKDKMTTADDMNLGEQHDELAAKMRASLKGKGSPAMTAGIEDLSLTPDIDDQPVLFDQRYRPSASSTQPSKPGIENEDALPSWPKKYRGVHLFVLVHGWQGNSFDMRLMKNNLALLFPDAIFLCSTSNEDLTDGDLNESGIRLAQEVVNYIHDWCPGSALGRLSFITFSQGGLIVRTALPLLHEYTNKMFTFMTISCHHLGYIQKSAGVVTYGLKMLTHWRKTPWLNQLCLMDGQDPQETFIYRLSKTTGLEFFQYVVCIGSAQDQFAPLPTARALTSNEWEGQPEKEIFFEMVRNLWENIDQERLYRFDVNFAINEKTFDSAIGRAAHIRFLENQPIMKMILHNYSFLFR
jgi:hypothetical protein